MAAPGSNQREISVTMESEFGGNVLSQSYPLSGLIDSFASFKVVYKRPNIFPFCGYDEGVFIPVVGEG